VTSDTPSAAANAWNAQGKAYAFYNPNPNAQANNCYALRSFFYSFAKWSGYDVAAPR